MSKAKSEIIVSALSGGKYAVDLVERQGWRIVSAKEIKIFFNEEEAEAFANKKAKELGLEVKY